MDGEYESFFQAYSFSAMTKMFKSKKSSPSKGDAQTATTLLIKPCLSTQHYTTSRAVYLDTLQSTKHEVLDCLE